MGGESYDIRVYSTRPNPQFRGSEAPACVSNMSIKDYFIVSCKNIWPDFLVVSVSADIKHLISMFCVQWQFPGSNTINWLITLTSLSHSTLLTSLLWYQWSRETDIKCWFLNTLFLVSKPFNQVLHQEQGSSVVGF